MGLHFLVVASFFGDFDFGVVCCHLNDFLVIRSYGIVNCLLTGA